MLVMLKSDSEKILRRIMEESKAQFSEEQIKCISQAILEIAEELIAEARELFRTRNR